RLLRRRQLAKRGAGAVEQLLPSHLPRPGGQPVVIEARHLVVVEGVLHPARIQPRSGLLHGVAIADAVKNEGQGRSPGGMACSTESTITGPVRSGNPTCG